LTFPNDAEKRVAEVLDSLRVAWEYEPTLFILEYDADGHCTRGFRPDFYLPKQDLYIEVTEQKVLTPKNGKLRQLALVYPTVRCVLLHRLHVRHPELRRIVLHLVRGGELSDCPCFLR
jgi:hypoxanthine phosphoribosyltransferase